MRAKQAGRIWTKLHQLYLRACLPSVVSCHRSTSLISEINNKTASHVSALGFSKFLQYQVPSESTKHLHRDIEYDHQQPVSRDQRPATRDKRPATRDKRPATSDNGTVSRTKVSHEMKDQQIDYWSPEGTAPPIRQQIFRTIDENTPAFWTKANRRYSMFRNVHSNQKPVSRDQGLANRDKQQATSEVSRTRYLTRWMFNKRRYDSTNSLAFVESQSYDPCLKLFTKATVHGQWQATSDQLPGTSNYRPRTSDQRPENNLCSSEMFITAPLQLRSNDDQTMRQLTSERPALQHDQTR